MVPVPERREETWASSVIARHLAAQVSLYDDNSAPGMVDAIIEYPNGRQGALEFTTDTNPVAANTWHRLGNGERHIIEGIGGGWALRVDLDLVDARVLLSEVPALLSCLEARHISGFGRQLFPAQHQGVPAVRRLWRLGVTDAVRAETSFPGSVYLLPATTLPTSAPDTVVDWAEGLLAGPALRSMANDYARTSGIDRGPVLLHASVHTQDPGNPRILRQRHTIRDPDSC